MHKVWDQAKKSKKIRFPRLFLNVTSPLLPHVKNVIPTPPTPKVQAAQAALTTTSKWGIFGHSAGAFTSISAGGDFELGRVAICPGRAEYGGSDPFFLIASEADGCYRVMGGEGFTIADALNEAGIQITHCPLTYPTSLPTLFHYVYIYIYVTQFLPHQTVPME